MRHNDGSMDTTTGSTGEGFRARLQLVIGAVDPSHQDQMRADLERIMTASRGSLKGLMSLVEDGERDSETRRKACWFLGRLADAQAAKAAGDRSSVLWGGTGVFAPCRPVEWTVIGPLRTDHQAGKGASPALSFINR